MDKDNVNSAFDFDNDPEFSENFYKNIEKALGDTDTAAEKTVVSSGGKTEEDDHSAELLTEDNSDLTGTIVNDTLADKAPEASQEESAATTLTVNDLSDEDIDEKLVDINSSLAKQISAELDTLDAEKFSQKKKRLFKIQSGVILSILCLIGFGFLLGFTKPGNRLLMSMGVNISGTIWDVWTDDFDEGTDVVQDIDYIDDEDKSSEGEEVDPSTIVWPVHPGEGRQEDGVYNILLLGEEAIGSGDGRGRTDVIVIATMNTNDKSLKLTSIMRDTLVQIPGFNDNKLNTAYEKGGLDLMYETIALNFDLHLDGCVMVNFENFEKIIDELGGLEITLTDNEADYLNRTNYISNPAYRNVVEGKQLLNGNQVLGYSRVRKTSTITGNNNDYGRTDRHRIVLNAIFEKYKSKSKTDLAAMMLKLLPMIKTDINSKNFEVLLNSYIEMGMSTTNISQLRIPADGTFEDNKKVRGMSVLIPDLEANIDVLHSFIFGDDSAQNTVTDTNTETNAVTGSPDIAGN